MTGERLRMPCAPSADSAPPEATRAAAPPHLLTLGTTLEALSTTLHLLTWHLPSGSTQQGDDDRGDGVDHCHHGDVVDQHDVDSNTGQNKL